MSQRFCGPLRWSPAAVSRLWSPTDGHQTLVTQAPSVGWALGVPPRMGTEPGLQADPLRLRGKLKTFWILSYTLHVMSVFSCQLSWKGPSFGTQKLGDLRGRPWVNNTDSQHANVLRNLFHVYSRWLKIVDPLKVAAVFWRLHIRG